MASCHECQNKAQSSSGQEELLLKFPNSIVEESVEQRVHQLHLQLTRQRSVIPGVGPVVKHVMLVLLFCVDLIAIEMETCW